MEVPLIALFALFGFAAAQDWKKRAVDDWVSILAWGIAAFYLELEFFMVVFVATWAAAEIFEKMKMPILGWADVLWVPVFACLTSIVSSYYEAGIMVLLSMLAGQIVMWVEQSAVMNMLLHFSYFPKKERRGSPYVMVMFFALIAFFLFKAFVV